MSAVKLRAITHSCTAFSIVRRDRASPHDTIGSLSDNLSSKQSRAAGQRQNKSSSQYEALQGYPGNLTGIFMGTSLVYSRIYEICEVRMSRTLHARPPREPQYHVMPVAWRPFLFQSYLHAESERPFRVFMFCRWWQQCGVYTNTLPLLGCNFVIRPTLFPPR